MGSSENPIPCQQFRLSLQEPKLIYQSDWKPRLARWRSQGGVSNVGFLEQVAAFEGVKEYIHRFGGDPHKVALLGESDCGSSISHRVTARGGTCNPGLLHSKAL